MALAHIDQAEIAVDYFGCGKYYQKERFCAGERVSSVKT
jgi:hypothetical protein